jgi:hypothetical protein
MGGALEVTHTPLGNTCVCARLPLAPRAAPEAR